MGRAERRKFNKKNGIPLDDKTQFDVALAMERIKSGNFNLNGLNLPREFMHLDNEELAPEGSLCKLNYDRIKERFDKYPDHYEQWFKDMVETFKDKEVHLTREGARNSLVCIAEDEREVEVDGQLQKAPKALFDVYSDLLFKQGDQWLLLAQIDPDMQGYKPIDTSVLDDIENKKDNEKGA